MNDRLIHLDEVHHITDPYPSRRFQELMRAGRAPHRFGDWTQTYAGGQFWPMDAPTYPTSTPQETTMTIIDPRNDPDAFSISIGDSYNTLAAMLQVLADGADGGYVISYARDGFAPIDLVVDEITRDPDDEDTLPVIVGRVWDDRAHGPIAGTLRLPIAGASIHIY